MRLTAEPGGTFEEDSSGRAVSGLIKRITFPCEDPGGWLLPVAMQQVPKPCKDKTKQMDRAESRELSISSQTEALLLLFCTDSPPSIKVTLSGFISLSYTHFCF